MHGRTSSLFTMDTASLATKAKISAQETTPGHFFSTADLAASITSKPLTDRFGAASFSAWLLLVEFKSTEPSHPCKIIFTSLASQIFSHHDLNSLLLWMVTYI